MWTCWAGVVRAEQANVEFGLALSADEIDIRDHSRSWAATPATSS
jgi:hypothetical protein